MPLDHFSVDMIMNSRSVKYNSCGKIIAVGPWQIIRTIGRGSSGKVRLAVHQVTDTLAAVKCLNLSKLGHGGNREVAILKMLNHSSVLRTYDVVQDSEKQYLYIIMEYAVSDLFQYLSEAGRMKVRDAMQLFWQILQGVSHFHQLNIVHRDLKLENILLSENFQVKIGDFGMARIVKQESHSDDSNVMLKTCCGSPHYASPEIVSGKPYDGKKSDVWSLGVILYALLTAQMPFHGELVGDVIKMIKSGNFEVPHFVPNNVVELIRRMLTINPLERISISELLNHEIFHKFILTLDSPNLNNHDQFNFKIRNNNLLPSDLDMEVLNDLVFLFHHPQDHRERVTCVNLLIEKITCTEPTLLMSQEKETYFVLNSRKQSRLNMEFLPQIPDFTSECWMLSEYHKEEEDCFSSSPNESPCSFSEVSTSSLGGTHLQADETLSC